MYLPGAGLAPQTQSVVSALSSSAPYIRLSLWPVFGSDGSPEDELQNWSSLIGITTSICGNVIIALALNVQRYAHIRLHRERAQIRERAKQALKNATGAPRTSDGGYGTAGQSSSATNGGTSGPNGRRPSVEARDSDEAEPLTGSFRSGDSRWTEGSDDEEPKVTSSYLKDPYWWLGQVLITIGEMGNFLAYGFAPASIVSPLGVVALVSNCVIAPIFFKEVFRPRDFWGVIVAVLGAVTVVLSAKQEETKLGPHEVWDAITTMEFKIYMGISCSLIAFLMWLSPRYGNRTILIDLGLVGMFGGYTALSTKGVSSMLSSTLLGAFATPVTYVLLFVLLSTAVMQVRYLNKALARFDSTQVIPIQFVSFTLSVIIGSAVLYRDFERTSGEQAVKFIGGCLLTFFGVFLITSGRPRHDEEDTLSDVEGVEETIGLSEQGPGAPQTPRRSSRRGSDAAGSRRSSRASRASFKDSVNRPLAALAGTGFPTLRMPPGQQLKSAFTEEEDEEADAPLLGSPWRPHVPEPQHPGLGAPAISSDSIQSVASTAVSDGELQSMPVAVSNHAQSIPNDIDQAEPPSTPRGALTSSRPHSHHFGGTLISPSPFSSTVTAVVADKLLAHMGDSPTARRVTSRRSRGGLRNSLFVPQDELDDEEYPSEISSAVERRTDESGLFDDDDGGAETQKGVRGRARSLSHTLGELFGVGRKRRGTNTDAEGEGEGLLGRRRGNRADIDPGSTETL